MVGLFPFAGNALPFISAGGSNLISTLAAIGILLNFPVRAPAGSFGSPRGSEGSFNATIDLRRWDRRRRVSRPRRPQALLNKAGPLRNYGSAAKVAWNPALVERAGIPFKAIPAAGVHGVGLEASPETCGIWPAASGLTGHLARVQPGRDLLHRRLRGRPDGAGRLGANGRAPCRTCPTSSPAGPPRCCPLCPIASASRVKDSTLLFRQTPAARRADRLSGPWPTDWLAQPRHGAPGPRPESETSRSCLCRRRARAPLDQYGRPPAPARTPSLTQMVHFDRRTGLARVEGDGSWFERGAAARYHVSPYLHEEMGAALAAADLALSLAGASSPG